MKVSIIIPHYELHDMLKNFCLVNLKLFTGNTEIIIVDNGSKHPLKLTGDFKIIRSKARLSFATCCNLGASKTDSDILVFLNNDCMVLPGWLDSLLTTFEDKKVAIVGAKLLNQDSTIQHVGISFTRYRLPYHHRLGERDDPKETGIKEVLAVTGALMAVRRDFYDEVDGFCEDFVGGNYEDVDLCLQAKKQNQKVVVALDSKVIHAGGASYQIHPEEHTDLLVRRNWEILMERWKGEDDSFFGIDKDSIVTEREKAWGLDKGEEKNGRFNR